MFGFQFLLYSRVRYSNCLLFQDAALDLPDADESERNPCDLHFLSSKRKKASQNLALLRASVHQRGERLCLPVNDEAYSGARKIFEYVSNATGDNAFLILITTVGIQILDALITGTSLKQAMTLRSQTISCR